MQFIPKLPSGSLKEKFDHSCSRIALAGVFLLTCGFYFFESYGGVGRAFYLFILLPTVLASPIWLRQQQFISWQWLVFLIPIAYLALSTTWVAEEYINPKRSSWYSQKPFVFLFFLLMAMYMVTSRYDRLADYLIKSITLVALVTGIVSLWAYLPNAIETSKWTRMAGISLRNDINVTATLYGANAVFCTYGILHWQRQWLPVLITSLIVSIAITLLSQSKIPLIACVLSLAWLCVAGLRKTHLKKVIWLIVPLVFVSLLAFYNYFERIPFVDRPQSFSNRQIIWEHALEQTQTHWLFGHGVGSSIKIELPWKSYSSHSHNYFIDTFRYGGLIGALLIIAQTLFVAFRGWEVTLCRHDYLPIYLWYLLGVAFLLTNGQHPLVKPHHIWFYYWVPTCLLLARDLFFKAEDGDPTKALRFEGKAGVN